MKKIFIDGSAGTTGLRIYDRLKSREDVELIILPDESRKVPEARKEALNSADIAFLCLPDAAAVEAVSMIENDSTVVIDTSTAHRTDDGWAYGFPELSRLHEENVINSKRIAVPGCHASGYIALVYPLVEAEIISASSHLSCFSLTGYSGGGKKMIADYEAKERSELLKAPRQYALSQQHKHLREMKAVTKTKFEPVFCPVVGDFYSGMQVTVPLFGDMLSGADGDVGVEEIKEIYKKKYNGPVVFYEDAPDDGGFLSAGRYSQKDKMAITVYGNADRILLCATYDNLGKGASGAALECLNLVTGKDKDFGLDI